ncbi:MAG: DIP1984 family protein [Peptostreptococcaceae bacterium]|nr:DIP1984 family protein [Peptostreptococcaceae bacterium]
MKLAEALQMRSDMQKKIEDLRDRLFLSAKYQEGEKPFEDPSKLVKELDKVTEDLEDIIYKINYTNSKTETDQGSLTKILAKRDALKLKRSVYSSFADEASNMGPRYTKMEIKLYPSMDVNVLRKIVDDLSKELRQIELLVQQTNWTTDLIEK